MIIGSINADREAVLPVAVQDGAGAQEYKAVIDTGFNGYLTLDGAEIVRLNLVLEAEGEPLIGMSLLYGYDVWLRVLDGSHVRVEAVP